MDKLEINLLGKDYFSMEEAAHYMCVSLRQFQRFHKDYGIFPRKVMGKQLFSREECKRAIESH